MLRLFTGIPVAGEARAALEQALERWRRDFPGPRWVAPEDLHITLQFIGAWPEAREGDLVAALAAIKVTPFELAITGPDAFPSLRHPRVLIAAVVGRASGPPAGLRPAQANHHSITPNRHRPADSTPSQPATLAAEVARALAGAGVSLEARPYRPHITLARLRSRAALPEAEAATHWGRCPVDSFNLYATVAGHYQVRQRFAARTTPNGLDNT